LHPLCRLSLTGVTTTDGKHMVIARTARTTKTTKTKTTAGRTTARRSTTTVHPTLAIRTTLALLVPTHPTLVIRTLHARVTTQLHLHTSSRNMGTTAPLAIVRDPAAAAEEGVARQLHLRLGQVTFIIFTCGTS
jgi:hypothetical protein